MGSASFTPSFPNHANNLVHSMEPPPHTPPPRMDLHPQQGQLTRCLCSRVPSASPMQEPGLPPGNSRSRAGHKMGRSLLVSPLEEGGEFQESPHGSRGFPWNTLRRYLIHSLRSRRTAAGWPGSEVCFSLGEGLHSASWMREVD